MLTSKGYGQLLAQNDLRMSQILLQTSLVRAVRYSHC